MSTLHLCNLSSGRLHGPGRLLCAMARPRHWEHGDGLCSDAAPAESDLVEFQRTGDLARYRAACEGRWLDALATCRLQALPPDGPGWGLVYHLVGSEDTAPVCDGDTLFCACAAPGSPRRTHPCHLELLAPYLVLAGWSVVLWGRRLVLGNRGADPKYPNAWLFGSVYADTGEPYDLAAYGWPVVTP